MLTTTAILLVVFLLSLFLGLAKPASASLVAAPGDPFAIYLPLVLNKFPLQTLFGGGMDYINSDNGLNQMAATNMSWTRPVGINWYDVEPTEGARNWSVLADLETQLQNASSKNIQVLLIVHGTPSWAQQVAGSFCGPIKSTKLAAFGNFMSAVVARYSLPPYNVKYWEMWNEPDIATSLTKDTYGCWGDSTNAYYGGGYYAEMLKATYPKIKAADLQAQVLVGGLVLDCDPRPGAGCETLAKDSKPPKFLEGILRNNGGSYFDGVSFHAYDYYYGEYGVTNPTGKYGHPGWQTAWNTSGPVSITKAEFVKSVLSAYSVSGKFLMNTETGVICNTCSNDPVFETTKAYYVPQTYASGIALGLRANLWYSVMGWRNSGLLNPDLSLRPAYTAFKFAQSELSDAKFAGNITGSDIGGVTGVKGYKLNRGDRLIWVVWSLDGNTHSISMASAPLAAWDTLGTSVTPAASMDISLNPLYLEWNP